MISSGVGSIIFNSSFAHVLNRSKVTDKNVRGKCCQIVSKIISNLSSDDEISEELWTTMMKTLMPRLHDKIPNIRVWAIKALGRFQNPDDVNDPIVTQLLNLMKNDSSKDKYFFIAQLLITIMMLQQINIIGNSCAFNCYFLVNGTN